MNRLTSTTSATALLASAMMSVGAASAQDAPAVPEVGDEIVVRGVFVPDEKRATAEIASVLDAEDFTRAGDSDVAAAIARVAGISVVDGKFPVARGLNERYQSATVNGVPLPSPEPLRRAVPLDIVPTRILDGSLTQKTYSPEFSAEFGGAAIDLRTAAVPDENFLILSASGSYDTVTSLDDGFFYNGSDTDVFGYDDGLRDLPSIVEQEVLAGRNFLTPEAAASFDNVDTLVITEEETPLNGSVSATLGGLLVDNADLQIGNVTYVGYSDEFQTREGVQDRSFLQNGVFNTTSEQARLDYLETRQEVAFNLFSTTGVEFGGGDHSIKSTSFLLRNSLKRARAGDRVDQQEFGDAELREEFTEFVERQVWQTQLAGEHLFPDLGDIGVSWRVAYGEAERDAPYERNTLRRRAQLSDIIPSTDPADDREIFAYQNSLSGNSIRFSSLEDTNFYSGLDFELPLYLGDREVTLKAGTAYTDNSRDTSLRVFRVQQGPNAVGGLGELAALRTDLLYQDEIFETGLLQIISATNRLLPDTTEASLEVNAVYGLADIELNDFLRVSVGGRFEDSTQQTATFESENVSPAADEIVSLEESYFLPAATVTWNPVGNLQVRAGVSKTITRPQFRELAGTEFLDPNLDVPLLGNPFLVNSEIFNVDARAEWYFSRGEFATLGVFFKDIDNPIERVATTRESGVTTFVNSPSAELYGAEFEFEKRYDLARFGDFWADQEMIFVYNYTYTDSSVGVDGDVIRPVQSDGTIRPDIQEAEDLLVDGHTLEGQSDHLINLQVGLENIDTGTTLTALLNYASNRTILIGTAQQNGTDRVVEDVPVLVDLVYRKPFELKGTEFVLGAKVQNILGQEFDTFREDNNGDLLPFISFDRGRMFSVSLSAEF
ncbi:TonB-dependent receptor [Parvularcula sp. ZS-1/3]|uniref:TonB-dependent receptor n=1 Tax=Parvularcula mediterranea TaxID=2732508 RepID=A0A7Y3RP02_9PROT|nr:TonB-dependent receptor [Parvularcula mediterranea]NNU17115.1 TonB-dependent receptor [Parvularcula mediterranea]